MINCATCLYQMLTLTALTYKKVWILAMWVLRSFNMPCAIFYDLLWSLSNS